ncbi:hypothetical protein HR12_00150 [Microbacterium sp. SUBG005]|nr:hypothetical protein HR12_00150 [Microbacterium sp. SUBG005]
MIGDRIVIVCTANVIRSPFVAALMSSRLSAGYADHLQIESAGTSARPATPAEEKVVSLGRTYGLDLDPHRSRRLDDGVLRAGDTVLCAERAHRRAVLDLRPDLIASVFTVREFSRLAEAVHGRATSWADPVRLASQTRLAAPATTGDDDLLDPIGGPDAAWLAFERQATQAVSAILGALAALPSPPSVVRTALSPVSRREYRRSREAALPDRRTTRRS